MVVLHFSMEIGITLGFRSVAATMPCRLEPHKERFKPTTLHVT